MTTPHPSAHHPPLSLLLRVAAPLLLLAACATAPTPPAAPPAGETAAPAAPAPVAPPVAASAPASALSVAAAEPPAASPAEAKAATEPIDPLRPDEPVNLDDRSARADLWERVRKGFAIEDLDGPLVRDRERYYAARPDYMQRMTERGARYLFHIVEEVERRGLPTELALLPFIESAFNPQALSHARASGMWQFMPATGRHFELRQNIFRDDRRDVLASTRAALDYLTRLHKMFGHWHLALAAYNWGEGSVARAIAANRRAGKPTDYESLRMPAETRQYVPKLQAIKNIVARPADYALTLPPLENHPYFLSVPIARDIDVELAARFAGLSVAEFRQLNPQFNKPVILAAGTPQLLLPYDNADRFIRKRDAHPGPQASWTAWVANKTLTVGEAARIVGMPEDELREVNDIPPRMLVRTGSTLIVPRNGHHRGDVSEHLADHAMIALAPEAPPQRRLVFKAPKGGLTVAAVAQRYRVSAAQVAQWNRVARGARFAAGDSIVVYTPQRPKAAAKGARAAKPAAGQRTRRR
jgi:membrane-bound lytic murein transglycosylase D